jgi:type IV pilus assembly protein PilB
MSENPIRNQKIEDDFQIMRLLLGARVLDANLPGRKIGDTLVELGFLAPEALATWLVKAKAEGGRLGEVLVAGGIITEKQLAMGLSKQFKFEFLDLDNITPHSEALICISEKTAREKAILPISVENQILTIAISDPSIIVGLQSISWKKKYELNYKISARHQLVEAIDIAYKRGDPVQAIVRGLMTKDEGRAKASASAAAVAGKSNLTLHNGHDGKESVSIEALVDKILENAIGNFASDIHIEPDEEFVRVRERVDGILQEVNAIPLELGPALISRIKILANLDFAEKRNSQDGRFRVSIGKRSIDLRISTLPTVRGEKIVLRILDKEAFDIEIENVGFSAGQMAQVSRVLESPFGIVFVTGPTGSGKSTTVYSMLGRLNTLEKNIITIEDPVEYQFNVINQVQVQPKIGFTFANILRGVLRQDPDIIMVGEIRDKETADIAIRASLTGHLVITTLHTNNSLSTITRLMDMGIEPSLLSGSLLGVLSQRLVRTLCAHCKTREKISELDLVRLGSPRLKPDAEIYAPRGCTKCRNLGFKGRTPIFEILLPDATIRKAILANNTQAIADYLKSNGQFHSMREEGIDKILAGLTTPTEVLKATVSDD